MVNGVTNRKQKATNRKQLQWDFRNKMVHLLFSTLRLGGSSFLKFLSKTCKKKEDFWHPGITSKAHVSPGGRRAGDLGRKGTLCDRTRGEFQWEQLHLSLRSPPNFPKCPLLAVWKPCWSETDSSATSPILTCQNLSGRGNSFLPFFLLAEFDFSWYFSFVCVQSTSVCVNLECSDLSFLYV